MKKSETLKKAIDYLVYRGIITKQKELAPIIGTTESNLSRAVNGDPEPTTKYVTRFYMAYQNIFNLGWLLTGEGEMLKGGQATPPTQPTIRGMLPEVPFVFAAGQSLIVNGSEDITRYWFLPDCTDCDAVVPITGTSMLPNLPPGCYVAMKRYHINVSNPNSIPFGNVFGVVVEDEATGEYHGHIKVLRRHTDPELAKRYWIAHSYNTAEYDDFDISIEQVRSLWIVKQHIVTHTF